MKQCSKCKKKKPLTEFVIARATKSGYKSYCKKCHSKGERKRHWNNRDELIIKMKERHIRNKVEINRKLRERYATDEEYRNHRKLLSKNYAQKHKGKKAIYMKDYYKKNKDARMDYLHGYQDKNRDSLNKKNRAYRKTENGKKATAKHDHKRRKLGYNELFPNILDPSEKPISHHVDDNNYVWVPEDVHVSFMFGRDTEMHREALEPIIVQLYPEYGVDDV